MKEQSIWKHSIFIVCLSFFFPLSAALAEVEISTATGNRIEYDDAAGKAKITGNAVVASSTATLKADEIEIFTNEKKGTAVGNVELIQENYTDVESVTYVPVEPSTTSVVESTAALLSETQPGLGRKRVVTVHKTTETTRITGDKAIYHWEASSGTFHGAKGVSPPWSFSADRLNQASKGIFFLKSGAITSCDHDPPHYRIKSRRSKILNRERSNMENARLVVEDAGVFWTPFYTRSLRPKPYTLRVEPGHSSRDGVKVKSVLGYNFTTHSNTRLRWDYLQETGNGVGLTHQYYNPKARGLFDSFYVRDHNSDPQPESRRYTILWNHYQKFTQRLSMNSKVDVKSDQNFGNQFDGTGNGIRIENSTRGLFSEGGFRYQLPKANLSVQFNRRDNFDQNISSDSFISKLTLPRISFNTIPLKSRFLPFYVSFMGDWTNETNTRGNPDVSLKYQRSANAEVEIKKDIKITKKLKMTPRAGYAESWKDRDVSTTSIKDIYQGRYNTGLDLRRRFYRMTDVTVGHRYLVRLEPNGTGVDTFADDRGIQTNVVNTSIVTRLGRTTRVSMGSGYNLLNPPRSDPMRFQHTSERIIPPFVDLQWEALPKVNLYFRESYSLFNGVTDRPQRTPLNTSGQISIGEPSKLTFFSQGFTYTKSASGAPATLNLTSKAKFFLSAKWHIDAFVSYQAQGPNKLDYRKVVPIEKSISVIRDLHCWIIRMSFSDRPGNREASFHIDLKLNTRSERDIFKDAKDVPFYPYRDPRTETTDVFQ